MEKANIHKIYGCSCGCAALELSPDGWEENDPRLNICIWRYGSPNSGKKTIKERLRWCWLMLTKGQLYTDDIILNISTVDELVNDLAQWSVEYSMKKMDTKEK